MPRTALQTTSVLGYALLGLLARRDQSGYDLTQGLKDPVAFFWHAKHSQVYPELAKLEQQHLVEHTVVEQSDRPDKKVYRLTARGRKAVKNWLESPMDVPEKRDELVLRAYTIWLSEPSAAVKLLSEHAKAHASRHAEYQHRLEKLKTEYGTEIWQPHSKWFGVHAVLQRGIGFEREYQAWCEWLAQALEGKA